MAGATVPLSAVLFDPATGKRVTHREDLPVEYVDSQDFMWTEGNLGCDCNRRLFMARASGEPEPEPNPCGNTIVLEQLRVGDEIVIPYPA